MTSNSDALTKLAQALKAYRDGGVPAAYAEMAKFDSDDARAIIAALGISFQGQYSTGDFVDIDVANRPAIEQLSALAVIIDMVTGKLCGCSFTDEKHIVVNGACIIHGKDGKNAS